MRIDIVDWNRSYLGPYGRFFYADSCKDRKPIGVGRFDRKSNNLVAWTDIIGTIARILVLLSFIPQIMKAYKTKKMFDLSAHLMISIASGMYLWVIYEFIKSDPL
jgi:hypothetical protein